MRAPTLAVLAAAASLAACGSSAPPLELGALPAADRNWAVIVATGFPAFDQLEQLYTEVGHGVYGNPSCPAATVRGTTATLEGGCRGLTVEVDGTATIGNYPPWGDADKPEVKSGRWRGFRLTFFDDPDHPLTVDGTVESELRGGAYRVEVDATFGRGPFEVHLDGAVACSALGSCDADDSAAIVVAGARAEVTGPWLVAGFGSGSGVLEVRGADTLRVDLASRTTDGCFTATLDGAETDPICFWRPAVR